MTQEDKELLLKDLSARLQYEVKVSHFGVTRELLGMIPSTENVMVGYDINDYEDSVIEDIKPYLRPMSSMTEEEVFDYVASTKEELCIVELPIQPKVESTDWLNKHHFDYRGLIEKGLALEAPEGMYS